MSDQNKGRRKRYLINRRVQLTVIAFNAGLALICIILMILQSYFSYSIFVSPDFLWPLSHP